MSGPILARGAILSSAIALAGCGALRSRAASVIKRCVDTAPASSEGIDITMGGVVLGRRSPVPYAIARLHDVEPAAVRSVIYILPGRDGTALGAIRDLGFAGALAALARSNVELRRAALVALDAGDTYFHPRTTGEDRLALVTTALPALLIRRHGYRGVRAEAIAGMSMGGFGALLAAEHYPSRYRAVAVAGPALFASYADEDHAVGDAFDGPTDFAKHDVIAGAPRLTTPTYVRCGDQDPFAGAVAAFGRHAPAARIEIVPGCHDDGFWRTSAEPLLRFVGEHLRA